ncbi:MAG: aldo/keto reductase [Sphaerochaetaceae bacterium]|nr:aldo/keto reductase [Sphaerochaetaceae bacterium]
MNYIVLDGGVKMPQIGLGVFRNPVGKDTQNAVRWALEVGYRHIDTAKAYKNEYDVGLAIKESSVKRKDIFLTTKIYNEEVRSLQTEEALKKSLELLKTDYLELYLIQWPAEDRVATFKKMIKLRDKNKIRAIGVSNFTISQIKELKEKTSIFPAVNQIEVHPYLVNQDVVSFCQDNGIVVTAYKPIGGGDGDLLQNDILIEIGKTHKKSPAQIVLRWGIQRNCIVIPKSIHKDRIIENFNIFDFELSKEEMKRISNLNKNLRYLSHPDEFPFD